MKIIKAYQTAKSLGSEGWELAGYTASGIILGDYLPVKNHWDEISSTIIPNQDKDIKIRDLEKEMKRKDKLLDEDMQGVESERTRLLSVAQAGKAKKRANQR